MNLVVGKSGFVAKKLSDRKKNYSYTSSSTSNPNVFYLNLKQPYDFNYDLISKDDTIILLGGISSPDVCEKNPVLAHLINYEGTSYFIERVLQKQAKVIFSSSDLVYGSANSLVKESDTTKPFGVYGKFKDLVEKRFCHEPYFKSIRFSYVLSTDDKYLHYLKKCCDSQETAHVFESLKRNIVYIDDILELIELLIDNWDICESSLINACGIECLSRAEIAYLYKKNVNNKLKIEIVEPANDFWLSRPRVIEVSSDYFADILGRTPLTTNNSLQLLK